MSNSTPSMLPGSAPGAEATAGASVSVPSALPPVGATAGTGDCGCQGRGAAAVQSAAVGAAAASQQAPSLRPGAGRAGGAAAAAWHSNVHVVGLWSINQDRNAWVYLDDAGWRKLSGGSESGLVAMNMLAAHAYQLGSTTSLYEGDDGSISQLYVW